MVAMLLCAFGGGLVTEGRAQMPASPATGGMRFKEGTPASTKLATAVAFKLVDWDVEDYVLFKVARLRDNPEVWVTTTVLSGGQWHK
jgi:hypothetical protein